MNATAWLAAFASAVYLARLLPQPLLTLATGQAAGVSPVAAVNTLIADAAWLAYGLSKPVLAVWLVSIPAILASGWTVVLLRRGLNLRTAACGAGWGGVVVLAGLTGRLSEALAMTVLVTCGPHLWAAYRHPNPAGVSATTWWVAVVDALAWGGYGVAIGDRALEGYGVVLLATALTMLTRLRVTAVPSNALVAPDAGDGGR